MLLAFIWMNHEAQNLMEKNVSTLDDKVDYYLHKISIAPTLTLDAHDLYEVSVLDEESYLVDQVMLEKGLVKMERGARVITGKGLEISNFGGWSLYQKLLRKEKQKQFFETDETYRKYEQEVLKLKLRINEMEDSIQGLKHKERSAQLIIRNLIKQNKNGKTIFLIGGIVVGILIGLALTFLTN